MSGDGGDKEDGTGGGEGDLGAGTVNLGFAVMGDEGMYRATACAQKNAPVVLTSSVRFHSLGVISMAC